MEILIILVCVLAIAIWLLWKWTEQQEYEWDFSKGRSGVIDLGKGKRDGQKTRVVVHVREDQTTVTREPR